MVSDYLLLRDYDVGKHAKLVKKMIERFAYAFFEEEEIDLLEKAPEPTPDELVKLTREKMRECIKPFCYFAASIWQSLHEDENPLSAKDATG